MSAAIPRIEAIVLSCDRYHALAEHMVSCYDRLWPDHPFRFRIPFQEAVPARPGPGRDYRRTPLAIKASVLSLIADIDDEEVIYWAIDDKYPVRLNLPQILQGLEWLRSGRSADACGLLFCRCRRMWDPRCLTGRQLEDDHGNAYLERGNYSQIWIHQFLRVKALRQLFEGFPDDIPFPRYLDPLKNQAVKPADQRLYVTRRNLAVFGESSDRGILTRNCRRSLERWGLAPPPWAEQVTRRNHYVGRWRTNARQRLRYLAGGLTGRMPDFFY